MSDNRLKTKRSGWKVILNPERERSKFFATITQAAKGLVSLSAAPADCVRHRPANKIRAPLLRKRLFTSLEAVLPWQ